MNLDEYFNENDTDMHSPTDELFQLEMHLADGVFQSLFKLKFICVIVTNSWILIKYF